MDILWGRLLAFFGCAQCDVAGQARSFHTDERGVVAVLFAITFAGVFLMAAIAIDYGRTESEMVRVQNAVDSAALAASHRLGLPDQDTVGPQRAAAYFKANMAKHPKVGILEDVQLDAVKGEVNAKAKGTLLTSLLKAAGIHELGFKANSTIKRGRGTIEVALVVDNSGSMADADPTNPESTKNYIGDLRKAGENLVNVLFTGFEGTEKVKVAVVPFAASVNVGASNASAPWMDTAGLSPVHFENFSEPKTRFDLLQQMGATWGGCVEARPSPHDVTDSMPAENTPASLFVPMFNPDEPDGANDGGNSYGNSYLPDYGGSCPAPPPECLAYKSSGACKTWSQPPVLSPKDAQSRVCKYLGASITSGQGPNYLCDTLPILPLTSDKSAAISLIQSLKAKGGTNILEGVMWGWRALSPEAPFTEGRPYDDPENDKFLIVMTDGENWHQERSNHNKSSYHSFGYASNGRLGTNYATSQLVSQMTAKTLAACQNAKAAGIKVYTIAFRLESASPTRAMLASCASGATETYVASNGQTLIQAFESIGREIAKLRIAG
jgi:Flp pilus assembly protein TadG